MPEDALSKFIEKRLDIILSILRSYLAGIRFETIDTGSDASNINEDQLASNLHPNTYLRG